MTKEYIADVKVVRALVSEVDEEYRVAAFQAILFHRLLTAKETFRPTNTSKDTRTKEMAIGDITNPVSAFMMDSALDPGDLSRLFTAPRLLLEKSLAVLKIARDKFGIDGL